jgi:ABC-type spermidine/putrescine transport system permease subunit II
MKLYNGARLEARKIDIGTLAMTFVTAIVAFLILFPLGMLIYGSFWTERPGFPGNFTLANYLTAYGDIDTYKVFFNTALLIGSKTIFAGII